MLPIPRDSPRSRAEAAGSAARCAPGQQAQPAPTGPTGRQKRPKGSAEVTRLAGVCEVRGWFRGPYRSLSGASAGAAASVSPGGTRRYDLWRGRSGFRSGSLAQSGPARGTSGRIGGRGGSGMRWRPRACEARRVEGGGPGSGPAWVQRRPGPGEGGRGDFRSPRVPSGPGGPPPQD